MAQASLFLHSLDPHQSIAADSLIAHLRALGFVGAPLAAPHAGWAMGENFLHLLTFMGCSPHVRLEPLHSTDTDFCHLTLHQYPQTQLLFNPLSKTCRCRSCGKPVATDWAAFNPQADFWDCPFCGEHHAALQDLRWRNDGGCARQFCEVHGIYPGEAQPVAHLLQSLKDFSGTDWHYFYQVKN